jgi:proteasome lid subunit RPN8/RPN11
MSSEIIYPVYIEWRAMVGAVAHAMHGLPHEVIGFLVGRPFVWNGTTYVYIKAALMGKANASETHVEFAADSLADIVQKLREKYPDEELVGWYHSHPGYGCFLSPTDLASHVNCFTMPYHVSMVVDPVKGEVAFFRVNSVNDYEQIRSAVVRRRRDG